MKSVTIRFLASPAAQAAKDFISPLPYEPVKADKKKSCQGKYLAERGKTQSQSLCVGYAKK